MSASEPSSNSLADGKPVYTSGVYCDEKSFKWEINNFEVVQQSPNFMSDQKIQFEVGSGIGQVTKWEGSLVMKSVGDGDDQEKHLGIYFKLLKKPKKMKQANVSYEVILTGSDSPVVLVEKKEAIKLSNFSIRHVGWGMIRAERTIAVKDLPLTNDGKLIIDVNFKIYEVIQPSVDLASKLILFESKSMQELQDQLYDKLKVLTNRKADEVTKLVSSNGVEFVVNRGLISSRCFKLKKEIENQSRRKDYRNKVHFDELSSMTLNVLIHYINTGTLLDDWKSVEVLEELTRAAHEYELKSLLEFLDDVMGSVCQDQNVRQLAILAQELELEKAEKSLFQHIKSNPALEHIMVELE